MKSYILLVLAGIVLLAPVLPLASAHGVCTGLQPRFGRLYDVALSSQSVHTGDAILITGKLVSVTQKEQQGKLVIESKPASQGRWLVTSVQPAGNVIDVPGNSAIPFSMTVKALLPGTYSLFPVLYLQGIGPGFEMFTGCNTLPVVHVTGAPICGNGLVAVIRSGDNSTSCVKTGTAKSLVERGWASGVIQGKPSEERQNPLPAAGNAGEGLGLSLSTDTDKLEYSKYIAISIAVHNTTPNLLAVKASDAWPLNGLSLEPCMPHPFGIAVYKGYYAAENITKAKSQGIFSLASLCPAVNRTLGYVFEPLSTSAVAARCEDAKSQSCSYAEDMNDTVYIRGFWDGRGWFLPGVYTIAGGDEWGHLALSHFVVANPDAIKLGLENPQTVSIDKNGTISGSGTLNIYLANFTRANGEMIIETDYPNDTVIYKTDTIPDSKINQDGSYRYNFTMTSKKPQEVYGDHRMEVSFYPHMSGIIINMRPPPQ